ncbi:cathepsin L-like [Asterias rubens]|uniref:cathepsin L-like n=1 Tax=Asterias rubens TaxID=7604 RepID=UPI0014558135|nr:cathepsin L-like [Asterias rubens]
MNCFSNMFLLCLSVFLLATACEGFGGRKAGGLTYVNPEDLEVQAYANFAVDEVNKRRNGFFKEKLVEVRQAQSQVVMGKMLHLNVTIQSTLCKKTDNTELEDCKFNQNAKKERCSLRVWVQPFLELGVPVPPTLEEPIICTKESSKISESDSRFQEFEDFRAKFERKYEINSEEYVQKYYIFSDNMDTAKTYNEMEQGTATYGASKFADMTPAEFKEKHTGLRVDAKKPTPHMRQGKLPASTSPTPDSFDWRTKGAVTPVKNQASCGSCWAFSTTGNIEGQWMIKKKHLLSLSEQQLVDCDKLDSGCEGGLPSNAYESIISMGGLEPESQYKYKGVDEKCELDKADIKVYINGSVNITSDESKMTTWLHSNGPISIGINAAMMQFYMGGVAHPFKIFCNPGSLDHGVLIVGYGTKAGIIWGENPYWIIKNSWGPDWGVEGYYLAYRGDGVCGLNTMCTSAEVE